jgi:hypothetical protein
MAITLTERILDLAYSGLDMTEIAQLTGASQATIQAALQNLSATPSTQKGVGGAQEANPVSLLYGNMRQVLNPARAARSNMEYLGLSGAKDEATGAATKYGVSVPIGVKAGDIFSKVGLFVGETAFSAITHQQAALYEGIGGAGAKPLLLANSADATSTAMPANTITFWTLAAPLTITATNAPNGFIYANYVVVGTVGTALIAPAEVKLAVIAKGGEAGAVSPLFIAASNKPASEEGEKPEAKLETTLTAIAKAPFMILA